ncbi:hypothetical protein BL250_08075 [Erwinia sp. OLTSP20]|nr:hypothetical protein BV501_08290 [Erwinia sp. OAMSP11]PIJ72593.1 hypothetical protein BK416_08890 [Erwinia sp. OLSSP12]PIJ82073.1 hypothetical protein BLD47_07015 [Erwinia sp. OLCASP19]PIJ84955.1 hypothetical protein BLD46_06855 [Erwinia sp. OLMTSP26]PIJ86559.1 hypothetical protein BLD49_08130 [Erwinia sp. OLMDSP33]PIJ90201.1 hypothetical protein BL249_13505 [Erwinia sp. OLFS4]PIJ92899.1 hypothetical protein BL250_08075 [Erwinia sp. OLTSP20]
MEHNLITWLLLSVTGLSAGSFFNVVIYRLPQRMLSATTPLSLTSPRSHCPHCKNALTPAELIPVFSWLALRGRCRHCHARISWRYPAVELVSWLIAILAGWLYQPELIPMLPALFFSWTLLVLSMIDFGHQLLPDILTLPLLWGGLLNAALTSASPSAKEAIIGAIAGYLLFRLLAGLWFLWRQEIALGGGDSKLLAALGAWLGWQHLPAILLIASSSALLWLLVIVALTGQKPQRIALGPWLALAGIALFSMQQYHPFCHAATG